MRITRRVSGPNARFEDRRAGSALALHGLVRRIAARCPEDLDGAFAAIDAARRDGLWVALWLDYSLGAWLDPAQTVLSADDDVPRLSALVFRDATRQAPWAETPGDARAARVRSVTPRCTPDAHRRAIDDIRRRITAGECYQVNYTFAQDVVIDGDPQALYRRIAARHPAAHAAYVEDGAHRILSFSPELFVARQGGTLTTRPMKGTAPRVPGDPEADAEQGRILHASVKNRAENLMIVDLLRNDLGRLARPGSVRVDRLFELERYPTIWTMTSTIRADAPDASLLDVLRALFPCGSVTGAPKIAAMRTIAELETDPRGLYCGSLGWLAPNGDFSLNVAIRTLVADDAGRGVYGVGGGIVLDSDPELEWQECQWKSRILRDCVL